MTEVDGFIQVTAPSTRAYEIWCRSAEATFCTTATFDLSNGLEIVWSS